VRSDYGTVFFPTTGGKRGITVEVHSDYNLRGGVEENRALATMASGCCWDTCGCYSSISHQKHPKVAETVALGYGTVRLFSGVLPGVS
jgi:hypothetical protein